MADAGTGTSATAALARTPQPTMGRRLRELRMSRELSLKEVSAGTGLSTSFLSMIETGRHELTVGRLVMLLDFFNVDLGDVIPEREKEQPVVVRRDERQGFDSDDRRIRTEALAAGHYGEMTTAAVRFEPGAELPVASSLAGPQFVLLLSGELQIDFADESSVSLREGDSVCFEASRHHRCVNTGDGEAHAITFKNEPKRRWEG
jgi:transcriptional regulator with XRE-family HTH domain